MKFGASTWFFQILSLHPILVPVALFCTVKLFESNWCFNLMIPAYFDVFL